MEEGWCNVDPNELVFTFGGSYACQFCENRSRNATESAQRWIHRQTQTSFIISPVLCAIAMEQITSTNDEYKLPYKHTQRRPSSSRNIRGR